MSFFPALVGMYYLVKPYTCKHNSYKEEYDKALSRIKKINSIHQNPKASENKYRANNKHQLPENMFPLFHKF